MPELTPYEKALLADPGEQRGYAPTDDVAEPATGPAGPASASPPPPPPPEDAAGEGQPPAHGPT